jgi:hypothetical protein
MLPSTEADKALGKVWPQNHLGSDADPGLEECFAEISGPLGSSCDPEVSRQEGCSKEEGAVPC